MRSSITVLPALQASCLCKISSFRPLLFGSRYTPAAGRQLLPAHAGLQWSGDSLRWLMVVVARGCRAVILDGVHEVFSTYHAESSRWATKLAMARCAA